MIPTLEELKEKLYAEYPDNMPHLTKDECIKSVYWIMRKEIEKERNTLPHLNVDVR